MICDEPLVSPSSRPSQPETQLFQPGGDIATRPPLFATPTRSRFASEDRAGEATFYPAGSPVPMDRRRDESPERRYYSTDRYVEEPETYVEEPLPPAQPVKKKSKWKQIFSRKKGKKKKVKETEAYDDERSLPPLPSTQPASFAEPLPPQPPFRVGSTVPGSDVSRRYELSDPGFVRGPGPARHMSVAESRDESMRARSAVGSGSVFGQPRTTVVPPAEPDRFGPPPVVRRQRFEEERYAEEEGSLYDQGPLPMLVDQQSGNRVPRDVSYASTGQRDSGTAPTKKKRSLGGTLKRMFKRKKKPAEAVQPITVHPPSHHSYEIEQDGYPHEEVYVPEPGVVLDPGPGAAPPLVIPPPAPTAVVVPAPASDRTHSTRTSARIAPEPAPVVVVPAKAPSSRGSAPPVVSPRSSHTRSSRSALPDVQVPITPRTSIPVRTGTGGSSTLYRPGTAAAPPQRYPTGSSYGFGRRGTPVAPPRDLTPSSESPSIRSAQGADRSWGEVHVPAEPAAPVRAPTRLPSTSRPGGLGLGTKPIAPTRPYVPRARPAPRTRARYPTAPAPRAPYVHVPRPIPPPPVYPTMPTLPRTGGGAGLEAQVHLIVTALRDLAAEDRHRTAVAEQRMAEERAWNEEERARDAELRDLVVHLARRSAAFEAPRPAVHRAATTTGIGLEGLGSARTTPELGTAAPLGTTAMPTMGEFGVREQVGIAAGGLGVGGSDVERLILIMRQGHEVTMQTFRQLIETWRKDIDIKHEEFLAEMKAREAARERRREKPIRWQPGVNIWQPA